ncbi:tyrosine-protein phosphatase [Streptomyces sp. NBC_00503]|uniref:tyrosine-protein phosphatase n=1 Tax=Streptomyces sp. NBC_00503 TaxID=2903659 RepID=UPI002E805210|nr:tyrosine-protein phosphatase [Streptomyces sp. NBC_00503]WUD80802.1 tyrosine-protein phosphatase [Streptomyces sp. NBC_00503]
MSRARIRLATAVFASALAIGTLPAAAYAAPVNGASAASRHHALSAETIRQIPLQGAVNVRDLGGYSTYTGGQVRQGLVYRSDALSKLTASDVTTVSGLGLTKVVDFRIPMEVQYDGADKLPAGLVSTSRSVSDLGLYGTLVSAIGSGDPVKQEQMLGGGRAESYMRDIYRTFVTNPDSRAQFATTLREIADGNQGPMLYHCSSGKDRTGWMSYVLLRALAVPQDAAGRDYLASNTFRAAYDAQVRAGLKQSGRMQNPDLLIPLQEVRQDYLDSATTQMEADYGSFYGYLTQGLGLDVKTLAKLQAKMVR